MRHSIVYIHRPYSQKQEKLQKVLARLILNGTIKTRDAVLVITESDEAIAAIRSALMPQDILLTTAIPEKGREA